MDAWTEAYNKIFEAPSERSPLSTTSHTRSPRPPQHIFHERAFVGQEWIEAESGRRWSVKNPATGELLGSVPLLSASEVANAIEIAHRALQNWKLKSPAQRCDILRRWFELCRAHREDLALLLTLEQGKPLSEARSEIDYGASYLEWYAEEGKRAQGQVLSHPFPDRRIVTLLQPVGVVSAITPWNFPIAMLTRKIAPALAAGCTMVLKPASPTPFSALALAHLGQMAGVPAGVLNIATGSAHEIGLVLTQHPKVRKLSFTGSTEVGIALQTQAAQGLLRSSMELGGNAPFIVFEDADLDRAVEGLMIAKFRNGGQTCICANRIYVHQHIHEAFVAKLLAKIKLIKTGPGWEEGVTQGPMINAAAVAKVKAHLYQALKAGAQCLWGGSEDGVYFQPTLLTEVPHNSIFLREETFGPLLPIIKFETEAQVLAWANDVPVGLAAYFYTQNHARVWRMTEGLEAGMVGVNEGLVSTAVAPFGGIKMSGMGREGASQGLLEYLEIKYCCHGMA